MRFYDGADRVIERTDVTGTATYTWTDQSELDTLADPLSGVVFDYTWDNASRLPPSPTARATQNAHTATTRWAGMGDHPRPDRHA